MRLIDQWCATYRQEPDAVVLDIDDSADVVYSCQQLLSVLDEYVPFVPNENVSVRALSWYPWG